MPLLNSTTFSVHLTNKLSPWTNCQRVNANGHKKYSKIHGEIPAMIIKGCGGLEQVTYKAFRGQVQSRGDKNALIIVFVKLSNPCVFTHSTFQGLFAS